MSHDKICTSNVSVVRVHGTSNIIRAGPLLCAHKPRDLVLGRLCSSNVKVVLRRVLECADLHASDSGYQLVT